MTQKAQPLGGPLLTRSWQILAALGALAMILVAWRFAAGLGATTALSDGYPWGLWIAFDVVTGTALACGGYAMAILVYIFNKGKYHPLVRPAILTSALGYSIAGFSVMIDIGRPWNAWKLPLLIKDWNLNSALLEVALCIMAYCVVLWIEFAPVLLEKWQYSRREGLAKFSKATLPVLNKVLVIIIAVGMLLPTMHQSSLGSLMLLTGPKLNALWNTPWLPLFFLVTCLAMGYAAVVFEATFSSVAFGRKAETEFLAVLQKIASISCVVFVAARFVDLFVRGRSAAIFAFDKFSIMFWIETVLFVLPLVMLLAAGPANLRTLFRAAIVLAIAGALYRFDTFLLAFDPGPGWHYFPSVQELLITFGLVALEAAVYIALVKKFPVLSGTSKAATSPSF